MSDIFTVVLDLSRVKNDKKKNQLYLAMADTTKMKMIHEFKLYVQFLFSLDCSVELFHENVRLPDLEDIRVLSRLDVVQVRPVENVEEKKCDGIKLISKSKECNENRAGGDSRPMPGAGVAGHGYTDSQGNVGNFKSLEAVRIAQAQDVSGFSAHKKAEMLCGPSFPASDRACSTIHQPKDNLMRKMCNAEENKTFRLGEKTGMAENLKLGTALQNKYYGWCGKSESNVVTGRSHFQKTNETPDLKSGEKFYMLKGSAKFTDGGVENKPCISSDLKLGDVNISKSTFEETIWGPGNFKEENNELCDVEPPAREIRQQSCSTGRPDPRSGPCGTYVMPGTVQKPLTSLTANSIERKFCAEGSFARKPLSVDEALKILTEAAAERSKTLSGNNPASHNDGKKNQFKGVCKTFSAPPAGGSRNVQKGNFKPQPTSKNPGTGQVIPDGHNTKVGKPQCQVHVPKQEMKKSKVHNKAVGGDINQGNVLSKGCEKRDKKQGQETRNTGKVRAKTGAPNPPVQPNPAQKKNTCKVNNSTETGGKPGVDALSKNCKKNDGNQGQETGKVKAKTVAPNPPLQSNPTQKKRKKKKKTRCENETVSNVLLKDCEHFDNNHGNDKIGGAGKTETKTETALSNPLLKYRNVENKIVPGDGFREFPTSKSAFLEEHLHSLALNEIVEGKTSDDGESVGFEKSPSHELNSSRGDSEPGVRRCPTPDNPTGADNSVKDASDFRFPENDVRPDSRRNLQMTDRVPENKEDGSGANVSDSSASSLWNFYHSYRWGVKQDVVAPLSPDLKQRKTVSGDDTSPNDGKYKSESHSLSPVTDRVITPLNKTADNASVEDRRDVNVIDNGSGRRIVSSQGRADLIRDRFGTEYAGALPGVGTGSIGVGGADPDSSGSRFIPTNEIAAHPYQNVRSVKTEESQDLHGPEGSGRDAQVGQLPSPYARSSGESANVRTGNDSGSDVANDEKKNFPTVRKECVIALVMIIIALAF